jgi:hypothetical protein
MQDLPAVLEVLAAVLSGMARGMLGDKCQWSRPRNLPTRALGKAKNCGERQSMEKCLVKIIAYGISMYKPRVALLTDCYLNGILPKGE